VSAEYLKLTAYFGERLRTGDRFLADALLDLYAASEVATSVMLRGTAGFGPRHLVRTDETLSMSEDPPIAVAAVDTADKIGGLADQVVAMTAEGLVTLERAHLGTALDQPVPDGAKLTVYVSRRRRVSGIPAYIAVCDVMYRHGLAGASALLAVDGTAHGERRRARFFSRNVHVPVMVIGIGSGAQIENAIGELRGVLDRLLLTVERAQLCKRDGELLARPVSLPATDADGRMLWQKLMVYTSEATLHDGVPIHRAIVRRLRESGTATGATALRGVWGYHGAHKPHGDKLVQLARQVPVTTIVIDSPERIAHSFDIVDELTAQHGLVTSELVPALVSVDAGVHRGDTRLARHQY
jgi:PII-like signaling protein